MTLALKTKETGYGQNNVRDAISYALSSAAKQADQRFEYYKNLCFQFEEEYGLVTDEFMQKFEAGELGDAQEYFDWYAAKHGLDIWYERREILAGISV